MGVIYKIQNILNHKCYIGKTNDLQRRKNEHFSEARRKVRYNSKFYNAVRKYGWDNFNWSILYSEISSESLEMAEICVIYLNNSYYEGYNSTMGGEGGIKSEEVKKKISESNKGRSAWNEGVSRSIETKKKISERLKNWHAINKHPLEGAVRPDVSRRNSLNVGRLNSRFGKDPWNKGITFKKGKLKKFVLENTQTGKQYSVCGIRQVKEFCEEVNISYSSFIKYRKCRSFTLREDE